MIKKYSVLTCLVVSMILIVVAATKYPGGSLVDKNADGFHWSKNFISNLFAETAINGKENKGRIWAVIGMAFHSIGYGVFFINMSTKLSQSKWARSLRFIGFANLLFIFLIATPLHDLGTISIVLTLAGLFTITIFILNTKLNLLKYCSVICLLTYYVFFMFYGLGYLEWTAIMQKVYVLSSLLLVIGLEYFSKKEDFINMRPYK